MLLRARKQGLIQFEGEMLFQRRDDHVTIHLMALPEQLIEQINHEKQEMRHRSDRK